MNLEIDPIFTFYLLNARDKNFLRLLRLTYERDFSNSKNFFFKKRKNETSAKYINKIINKMIFFYIIIIH